MPFVSFRRQAVKIELRQLAHSSKLPLPKGRRSTSVVAIGGGGGGSSMDVCDTAVQCERDSQDTAQLRSVASRIQVGRPRHRGSHVAGYTLHTVLCCAGHMLLVLQVHVVG